MLFESGEYGVLCFAAISDVAFGACDAVDYIFSCVQRASWRPLVASLAR